MKIRNNRVPTGKMPWNMTCGLGLRVRLGIACDGLNLERICEWISVHYLVFYMS